MGFRSALQAFRLTQRAADNDRAQPCGHGVEEDHVLPHRGEDRAGQCAASDDEHQR